MKSQKLHHEKHLARKAVSKKVKNGSLPKANTLNCCDCGKTAECYDHAKGYNGANRFYIEAVCWPCHRQRGKTRGEYRNGRGALSSYRIKANLELAKKATTLYKTGLDLRSVGALIDRSHEWVRKAVQSVEKSKKR